MNSGRSVGQKTLLFISSLFSLNSCFNEPLSRLGLNLSFRSTKRALGETVHQPGVVGIFSAPPGRDDGTGYFTRFPHVKS